MHRYLAVLLIVVLSFAAPLSAEEKIDLTVVNRIKYEAFENSQAMDHIFYLADVHGPRLTNSPGHRSAAEWAMKRLESYGLKNVHLEKWGPFGKSWKYTHFSAHLIEPQYQPLIGFPLAWTPGTNGAVTGEPILAIIKTEADFDKFKGKLKGKIVLTMDPKAIAMVTAPQARRWTDEELRARSTNVDPSSANPFGPGGPNAAAAAAPPTPESRAAAEKFRHKTNKFLVD